MTYGYDYNGNMTTRGSYTLTHDAENRLTTVSGPATASFVYDADGGRVKATFGATTTIYVGSHYEKTGNALIKYYYAGDRRIAMRTGGQTYYLFPDHQRRPAPTLNSVCPSRLVSGNSITQSMNR